MKNSLLKLCFLSSVIFLQLFPLTLLASETDLEQVESLLQDYKKGVETSNFKVMAHCSPPPMDKVHISNENMLRAFKDFATVFEKAWGNELIEGVNLAFFRTHPLSYLTEYEYSNIKVNGRFAKADTLMTVNGKTKKSVQHLAKINGKWYVVQKEGPPEYSPKDRDKIMLLSVLLQEQADFIRAINKTISEGAITQEECIRKVQERIMEFEEKRVLITNS